MLDKIFHPKEFVTSLVGHYGIWVYAILFGVIFAETGFVVFPFLPGDSLLFMVGFVAADKAYGIHFWVMFLTLTSAAIIGNMVNYGIGKLFGARLFSNEKSKIFSKANRAKTEEFFAIYGGKTIIMTRFVPVVRAFAPFIAGMGAMEFPKFMAYNVISGVLWVGFCMFAGFFLGKIPIVQERFEIAIVAITVISVLPVVLEVIAHRIRKKKATAALLQQKEAEATETADAPAEPLKTLQPELEGNNKA